MKAIKAAALVSALLWSANVSAVNLSESGIGELAVVPYFTVQGGWVSTLNIINVSTSSVAVKVRFKEGLNSREVFNFTATLRAMDTLAGVIRDAGNSPIFQPIDQASASGGKSCLVPISIMNDGQAAFFDTQYGPEDSENDDGGPLDAARMKEGHIEILVMGHTSAETEIGTAINESDCQAVDAAFQEGDSESATRPIATTAQQFGEPISALLVTAGLLNPQRGVEIEVPVTVWEHFYDRSEDPSDALITPDDNANCTSTVADQDRWEPGGTGPGYCRNLIAAQNAEQPLEPSLNSGFPPIARWMDSQAGAVAVEPASRTTYSMGTAPGQIPSAIPSVTRPRFIDALSLTIQRSSLLNLWSINPSLGVSSEWMTTYPTKRFYTDNGTGTAAALSSDRNGVLIDNEEPPYAPFPNIFSNHGERRFAGAQTSFFLSGRDRSGAAVSEPPPSICGICALPILNWDYFAVTNSLRFQNSTSTAYESLLESQYGESFTFTRTNESSGWATAIQTLVSINGTSLDGPVLGSEESYLGLPAIGFSIRQRTFGNAAANFASCRAHGFERSSLDAQ